MTAKLVALTPPRGADALLRRQRVLTGASLRAADRLGMAQRELAVTLGVSESTISRMRKGTYAVSGKEFELAAFLVRVFRSLDAIMGGDEASVKAWFEAKNQHLGGVPRQLVQDLQGLFRVAEYLDFMRGAQ